jgi:predicted RNase H-like nuclease (RuvC/YqgF family)
MAQDFLNMKKEIEKREQEQAVVKEKLAVLEKLQQEIEDKKQRFAKLRKLLDSSKEVQEQNKEITQKLQKELDDLLLELDGLKKQQTETKKEIELLMAELEKRKIPEDKKPPPVQVQPSGSGMAEGTKVYFVEASGSGLKVLQPWGDEDYRLSAKPEVVVADHSFNHFLLELQKDKNSLILFLIRDDGYGAFNNGAGRAESDYGIRVGKLPIPGRGDLQLDLFETFRGKVPPPPPPGDTPIVPAPMAPAK